MCACLNVYVCSYVFFWQLTVDAELYTLSRRVEKPEQLPPPECQRPAVIKELQALLWILAYAVFSAALLLSAFHWAFPLQPSLCRLSLSISVACLNQQWGSPGRAAGPTGTLSFPEVKQCTSALCSRLGHVPHPRDREREREIHKHRESLKYILTTRGQNR